MQNLKCPQCGALNRATARFCGTCRASLQTMPPASPVAPAGSAQSAALPTTASPRLVVPPAVKQGAGKALGSIAHFFTFGGRAAYAELIAPKAAASGMIQSMPNQKTVPAPIEIGCFAWAACAVLGAITLTISGKEWWWALVVFAAAYLVLMTLALIGVRRPFFSRLTLDTLTNWITGKGRGTQPELEFLLAMQAQNQVLVSFIGPIPDLAQAMPMQGHAVQVWGIPTGAKTLRAWKLEFLDQQRQPAGVFLATARIVSLTAALLIPVTFWLLVWVIVKLLLQW